MAFLTNYLIRFEPKTNKTDTIQF